LADDAESARERLSECGTAVEGFAWQAFRGTKLAQELMHANAPWLVHGPHEGLLLDCAACAKAVELLFGTAIGEDLWVAEQPVEEFALQSIAARHGLRFCQLGDMSGPEPERASPELRMMLTKTTREPEVEEQA